MVLLLDGCRGSLVEGPEGALEGGRGAAEVGGIGVEGGGGYNVSDLWKELCSFLRGKKKGRDGPCCWGCWG